MIEWTEDAEKAFQRYVSVVRRTSESMGADPSEVAEDLRRHIEEELGRGNSTIITEEDVRQMVLRMGLAYPPSSIPREAAGKARELRKREFFNKWIWILGCGVALPMITLIVELVTRMCTTTFFDPVPTVSHGLLILLVPVANLWLWWSVEAGHAWSLRLLGWFHATAMGVALYYTIIFLPLLPIGLLGVICWGVGLLPLAPILSFSVAVGLCRRASKQYWDAHGKGLPGITGGLLLGVLILQGIVYPATVTRLGLSMAASPEPTEQSRGIDFLSRYGDSRTILDSCRLTHLSMGTIDLLGGIIGLRHPVSTDKAREIFYRVTGEVYASSALVKAGIQPVGFIREDDFDSDQGEPFVGSAAPGVSLTSSRMDGSVAPGAALGYLEWTLEFRNDSQWQQEARGQIVLPPGGVVSRLTLWVRDVEREAAFGSRAKTRQAYEQVVQRRLDPVIVTTCGKDRVAFQCFPVPTHGRTMKIRLGITFPLVLVDKENAFLHLPYFAERNFKIDEILQHSVWVESKQPFENNSRAFLTENPKPDLFALRGNLTNALLDSATGVLCATRNPEMVNTWAPDLIAKDGSRVQQSIKSVIVTPPERVVMVLDGSVSMQAWAGPISRALNELPDRIERMLVHAGRDGVEVVESTATSVGEVRTLISEKVASFSYKGGSDNTEALCIAWDLASEKPGSVILWIHGPQPVLLGSVDPLIQRWERRPDGPQLLSLQVVPGPDKVIEKLDGVTQVTPVMCLEGPTEELKRLFKQWSGEVETLQIHREKIASGTGEANGLGEETSAHLVRLWAKDQIDSQRASASPDSVSKEVTMASAYKLVTPRMGAVVLETEQQYQVAGLKVPDAQGIPTIPEPQTWMLILVVLLLLAWAVTQQRRRGCLRG